MASILIALFFVPPLPSPSYDPGLQSFPNTSSRRMAVGEKSIENRSLITISGETFNITEVPPADSRYVQQLVEEIACGIRSSELADDLRNMSTFTRIALHCAVVKGDPKLEGSMQEFGIRLATLCDDSAIAIGRFQRTSTTVIETLLEGFSYLLEGFEDMAIDNLEDVQHAVEEMEVISKELHKRFEDEGEALKSMKDDECTGEATDLIAATKSSLLSIVVTIIQSAMFWNRMSTIAEDLQSEKLRKRVKKAVASMSPEKLLRLWTSSGFKKDAIAHSAKWVAYSILCNDYMKGIAKTRAELYACVKELILPTEASEKLKVLLKEQQQ